MVHYLENIIIDGELRVEILDDTGTNIFTKKLYKTIDPITLYIGCHKYYIPNGFILDFTSIPRCLRFWFSDSTIYGWGGLIHDYLYKSGVLSRKQSDELLYNILKLDGSNRISRILIYYAVRMFGWIAWKTHRKI